MGAQLNSYLMSEDARSQADFYLESLGGEIVSLKTFGEVPDTPEDMKEKVMHLSLKIAGNNILMLSDSFEQVVGNRSISLALTYDNESEAREQDIPSLVRVEKTNIPLLYSHGAHTMEK